MLAADERAPGRDADGRAGPDLREREGTARGARRLLRRRRKARHGDDPRAAREHGDDAAELLDRSSRRHLRVLSAHLDLRRGVPRSAASAEHDAHDALLARADGGGDARSRVRLWIAERADLLERRAPVRRPPRRILRQHPIDERLDVRWHVGARRAQRRRRLEHHLREDRDRMRAAKRRVPGQAREHHRAERVHVGAWIDRPAADLLRRHVRGRPDERARLGEIRVRLGPRDPEVEQLDRVEAPRFEEEVRRFEIAMDDPARMRGAECARRGARDEERVGDAERMMIEARRQIFARQPLHREVLRAVVHRAVREVANDVRVIDRGEHLDLAREPERRLRRCDDLERDLEVGLRVARSVHPPHASGRRERDDLEAIRDDRSDPRFGGRRT
jgi:hypothetical protein